MNGVGDHVHMLINLPSSVSLVTLMQAVKQSSSKWLSDNSDFPDFRGWGKEYYAATIHREISHRVIEYIKNQENHHLHHNYDDELRGLYMQDGVDEFMV